MRDEPIYHVRYPVIQVRPWGLLAYDRVEYLTGRRKKEKPLITTENHSSHSGADNLINAYSGVLTPTAKKRLKRAIQLMVASAEEKEAPNWKTGKVYKFKVNFITLTLPAPQGAVTDKQLKKEGLDNFIKRMRRKFGLNSYVWRAERQKNGNLHFHLISDTWIHYEKIRNDWNDCMQKFGYIDQFEAKHGHRNPNSTDVHAVWKVKNLTQYFIKYMSKDHEPGETVEGKLWDCSKNLKTKRNCETLAEGEALHQWSEAYADGKNTVKSDTNFTLIFLNERKFKQYVTGGLLKLWEEYLEFIRHGAKEADST